MTGSVTDGVYQYHYKRARVLQPHQRVAAPLKINEMGALYVNGKYSRSAVYNVDSVDFVPQFTEERVENHYSWIDEKKASEASVAPCIGKILRTCNH